MKKKLAAQSALCSLRAILALLLCAGACFIVTSTLFAFLHSEAPTQESHPANVRLTFEDRVTYQRAIEDVYWRHRIWPKENPTTKPSLDSVMSQAQLERKVEDYLRKSQKVENDLQHPITPEELQAEMDRMAENTKQPEVLRELFAALGNDPFVIAECLAKPALVERYFAVAKSHRPLLENSRTIGQAKKRCIANANYLLPSISDASTGCSLDTWTATSTIDVPSARQFHTAVWTGSEMIVWGGQNDVSLPENTGGRYNPATDTWTATTIASAPTARAFHTAVWTGIEMIVWGGQDNNFLALNSGGRYDPMTDNWTETSVTNAPDARLSHTAVWTGTEMVVWGGAESGAFVTLNTGGKYDPVTDAWTATTTDNAPTARELHTAVWNGNEMIVWGGLIESFVLVNTGGKYNPNTNSWTATTTTNAPEARYIHTAVWTGREMIVWGGANENFDLLNTGGRYNPATDSWTPTTTTNAPDGRYYFTAVWTHSDMIVWGGYDGFEELNTGGKYDPSSDNWTATTTANAPSARKSQTAVWSANQMIVWGGGTFSFNTVFNTGGRYCAQAGPSPTATSTATPSATASATATTTVSPTATPTTTATTTPSATPRQTPTPRIAPTQRPRPTPPPRP